MSEGARIEWCDFEFGQLCQRIVNGGTPSTDVRRFWSGTTPWVTGADFTSRGIGEIRRFVSDAGIGASATSVVKAGNLLVVTRTGVGKLAIAPFDIAISQDISGVYVDGQKAATGFVFHLLTRELEELKKLNQGTSINGIIRSDLERHVVRIPRSKTAQLKIAAILTSIDTAIEKTEALIAKYQQIKAGLMHDLFTRGVLPNGQLRPPREQAPELYLKTGIGWIPTDWTLKLLQDISDVIDAQPDHRTPQESVNGIPYVGIGDFDVYQELTLSSCRKVAPEAYEKQRQRFEIKEGDVIYGKIGTIGQPKRLPFGGYAVTANVILFKPKIDSSYFYYAISSRAFEKQIANITNTTSQPALGIEKVRCLQVPMPHEEEAKEIGKTIRCIADSIVTELRQLDKLKHQKLGLMQDLLTGKVQVKVSEPTPELLHA